MESIILKYVLKNIHDFGSVNSKAVLGMVLRENKELKKNVPEVLKAIEKTTKIIEKLSKKEIKQKLKECGLDLIEKKEEKIEGPLKPLPNAEKGKIVVRIAPSPSGPLHIGHAYGASLNYEYAKMYNGKFIVRIEDTNPENIYAPAYKLIEEDARWLSDDNISEIVMQSSRLGIYYDYAEKLVNMGKAYVCECNADEFREMKAKGDACPCRDLPLKEQQTRYAKMFGEYTEGEAVLRLKTDIKHKNPAMRDFGIMRINEHIHPKIKNNQRVWPLMVFSVAIDDHEMGLTHVLNGKDHTDNAKKEAIIMNYLGWKPPIYKHWGRINFEGFKLSTTKTKLAIEQGEYASWEDIRLMTLMALRKRGYQAGAFRKYATEIGLSLNDKTVSKEEFWKNINSFNREIVEPIADRYFFVDDPMKINIIEGIKRIVKIDLHPSFPKRGGRKLKVEGKVYISKKDLKNLKKGKTHRLMDYCNFEIVDGKYKFVSEKYEDYKNSNKKGIIIHWLPVENVSVDILMDDGKLITGLGEKGLNKLKVGELVQFERRFFARLVEKNKDKFVFWYLHK